MKIERKIEACLENGDAVSRFLIVCDSGISYEFTDFGARWIAANVPDRDGRVSNVLLGYDELSAYLSDGFYMGATVGRFANRIGGASFVIDGKEYLLEKNDGENTNHGGFSGFHNRLWQSELMENGIRFSLSSPDGEGGYPGNVRVVAEYSVVEDDALEIRHYAETDMKTYVNLTNHAYFNLGGAPGKVTDHLLRINSGRILSTGEDFIPDGRCVDVAGGIFDFREPKPIGRDMDMKNEQMRWNRGYNHCYVLKDVDTDELLEAATLHDEASGRKMRVETDLPSVLLYTAGYYTEPHAGLCLETQFFPDTPSHPHFPSCLLLPGERYSHRTVFTFIID